MRDVAQDAAETAYECFECGNIVLADTNPGSCPDCAGVLRNRHTPFE